MRHLPVQFLAICFLFALIFLFDVNERWNFSWYLFKVDKINNEKTQKQKEKRLRNTRKERRRRRTTEINIHIQILNKVRKSLLKYKLDWASLQQQRQQEQQIVLTVAKAPHKKYNEWIYFLSKDTTNEEKQRAENMKDCLYFSCERASHANKHAQCQHQYPVPSEFSG